MNYTNLVNTQHSTSATNFRNYFGPLPAGLTAKIQANFLKFSATQLTEAIGAGGTKNQMLSAGSAKLKELIKDQAT